MQGLHLTADLYQCRCAPEWLTDAVRLGDRCRAAVEEAGLQAVATLFHSFAPAGDGPSGVTATILLAESHLCVHTWPELGAVTLDVYVCNFGGDHSARARALMHTLLTLFEPEATRQHSLARGATIATIATIATAATASTSST